MRPMGRSPWEQNEKLKIPRPKSFSEVPSYLKELFSGFFKRLLYIFILVWEAKPMLLFLMMFMALFNGFMPVLGSYISANLLNSLAGLFQGERNLGLSELVSVIIFPLALQFLYLFFNVFVNMVGNILTSISGEVVTNHVKVKIMKKAHDIDIARFDMPEFYEKLENASREAGMRPISIMNFSFSLVSTVISIISYIVILAAISSFAPIIVILLSIPGAVITFSYRRKNFEYMFFRSKDRRQMNYCSDIVVNKDAAKEIRLFGLCDTFIKRYNEVFKGYFSGLKKLKVTEGVWNITLNLVTAVVNCALFLFIAYNVYKNNAGIGDYSLYTGALTAIANGVSSFIATTSSVYEGSLFIDNLMVFMKEKKQIVATIDPPREPKRQGHTIELENVSFRYPGTNRDVIKNVSFKIEQGDTVVMVGLNGAGKTTLIKLLTRLYDPSEGRILLDGCDIREYDVEKLYRIYGIIFQDFGKYAASVRENIAFGDIKHEIDEHDIVSAAKASNAHSYITNLSHGYDTPLMRYFEDDGVELSIGQWQKLAIARAFYSDSDILILDEPTASLDAIAEQEVFSQFDKLRRDKTTIFVSHRLSSATLANKILVLSNGELVESGCHEELMAKKGEYYKLFSTQAKRYISSTNEKINDGKADYMFSPPGEISNQQRFSENPPFVPNLRK